MAKDDTKKTLSDSFVANHEGINEDDAGALIVSSEQKLKSIQEQRDGDEQLIAAKQIVKDIQGVYSAAAKYERAKINFLLEKIAEIQGGDVNPTGVS